ncbi:PLP-dependent cysteine synthase family protein [Streptomyces sp. NPDC057623]|uniref:PLP-dependent cysteine synthase family protein n=1 Tax=Streptomyces sp. NPDC057623 TaxID=3346187 RepID=UPI0036BBF132
MSTTVYGKVYGSAYEAMELPRIIRVRDNLYAAAFNLMKLLPARYILEQAEKAGLISPGTPILETSSGTFGLGLAMVCQARGYPLTVVGDPVIDQDLKNRLEMLGATVDIVEDDGRPGGIQAARLSRVDELHRERPESFIPGQYDNPDNPAAYAAVGELIAHTLGGVECLVGPVGSGGSTAGVAASLRRDDLPLSLVGVDTHGSVLFGAPDGKRLLRGLGMSLIPGNVDHTAYDEIHWVAPAEAFHATHELYRRHGLFMGPTSGASYQAASWWAEQHPDDKVLMLLPDEGYRYQSTVYNDAWLRAQGVTPAATAGPRLIRHPSEAGQSWARLVWGRRSHAQVVGPEGAS